MTRADWTRSLRLALLAFFVGWASLGLGASSLAFLWKAYQHGGL